METQAGNRFRVGGKVTIVSGPHAGRTAEVYVDRGPRTVSLSVLGEGGKHAFWLWSAKKANLAKAED